MSKKKTKKTNHALESYKQNIDNYYGNPNDYGNTYSDEPNNFGNSYNDIQNNYNDSYNSDDYSSNYNNDDHSDFAEDMYKSYVKEHPKKRSYFSTIILILLTFSVLIGQITFLIYKYRLSFYNELNDSNIKLIQYKYDDLERTQTTAFPYLIEKFPETKNYSKFCLPCTSIFPELKDVFNTKLTKREIENIKNIPLDDTDLYKRLADKTEDLINKYKEPIYLSAFDILQKPSVTDLNQTYNILRSWLWTSLYYSYQGKKREALLLAYAPILVCQDIEVNSADGADINIDLMEVQLDACKQLLYLANYTETDGDLCKKISKNFIKILSVEPSFTRKIENRMRCDKNFFAVMGKKGNAFAKYINNSKKYKELYEMLYEGAIEQTKEIEKTGNFQKFYLWQKDITNKFQEPDSSNSNKSNKSSKKNTDIFFWNMESTMSIKAFSNSIKNFYFYYCLNLERISIMQGTAVALGLKAYELKVDSRTTIETDTLGNWLGINIPLDPISRSSYVFYVNSKFEFTAASFKNNYYNSYYLKGEIYLPLLLNKAFRR